MICNYLLAYFSFAILGFHRMHLNFLFTVFVLWLSASSLRAYQWLRVTQINLICFVYWIDNSDNFDAIKKNKINEFVYIFIVWAGRNPINTRVNTIISAFLKTHFFSLHKQSLWTSTHSIQRPVVCTCGSKVSWTLQMPFSH